MITGQADGPLPGTQPAPKRAPAVPASTSGREGKSESSQVKQAEAALVAAQEAGLPQNFIDELAQEVQCRRVERKQQKPIGARLDSASAATKRAKGAWETARAKHQEAEALVASAAGVLVSAREAEKVLWEKARTECTKEHNDYENKTTAAELHEVLRNVIDSAEKAWPSGAQSLIGLQEAVSVGRATLTQTGTWTSNSAHEKPKQDRQTNKVPKRRRIESLKTDEGSNKEFDDDSAGFTTSEDEEMLSKHSKHQDEQTARACHDDREDFERHFLGAQQARAYTPHPAKTAEKHPTRRRQQREP